MSDAILRNVYKNIQQTLPKMKSTEHSSIRSISNPLPDLMCFEHFLWTYDTEPIFLFIDVLLGVLLDTFGNYKNSAIFS